MSKQDVQTVEKLLTGLGYDLTGHASGRIDAPLESAINQALSTLKTWQGIPGQDTSFQSLKPTLDQSIATLTDFTTEKGLKYLSASRLNARDAGNIKKFKEAGVPEPFASHFDGLKEFIDHYEDYSGAIIAVQSDITQRAAAQPEPTQQQQKTTDPYLRPMTVSAEEAQAAANISAEEIKAFQKAMASLFPGQKIQETGKWDGITKAAYIEYGKRITGKPAEKLTTQNVAEASSTALAALRQQPRTTPETQQQEAILTVFSAVSTSLKPIFEATHTALQTAKKTALASSLVEKFLSAPELVKSVNDAGQKLDPKWKFAQPKNATDGQIDESSQTALQQLLAFSVMGLNLTDFAGANGAGVPYSPELGQKILEGLKKAPKDSEMGKLYATLEKEFPEMEDPNDPTIKRKGAEALIAQLDYLYLHNILERQKKAEATIPTMDPIQMGILRFAINWIQEAFPSLLPMLDGLARQYMGVGLSALIPGLDMITEDGKPLLGGMDDLDPYEQLVESFKRSFKDAPDQDQRKQMQAALEKAAVTMSNLPFGKEQRQEKYPEAVSKALDAAMAEMGNIKPGDPDFNERLDSAAKKYATSFMDSMKTLNKKYGGATLQDNPPYKIYPPEILQKTLSETGFNLDGNPGQVSNEEIDQVIETYNNMNYGVEDLYNHKPLIFKDEAGKTYIAGIDQKSNMFTIMHLDVKGIEDALKEGKGIEAIESTYPGYAFANRNYRPYFNNAMKVNNTVSYNNAITYIANKVAAPFHQQSADEDAHKKQVTNRQLLEQTRLNPDGARRLQNRLAMEAKKAGSKVKRPHDYNPTPEQQELIDMQTMLQSGTAMRQQLSEAPRSWVTSTGTIYLFSYVSPYQNVALGQRDITEEMSRFSQLNKETANLCREDRQLMREYFPALSAVAIQYPQYKDAFDLAQAVAENYNIRSPLTPVATTNMPQWLQDKINDSVELESLKQATESGIQMYKPQDGHVYIVSKGDAQRPFVGHDVGDELKGFAQLSTSERAQMSNIQAQYPGLADLAAHAQCSVEALADSLLQKENVKQALGVQPSPYGGTLVRHAVQRPAQ